MTALLLAAVLSQAVAADVEQPVIKKFVPMQGDISGGGAFGERSQPAIALFVGGSYGVAHPPWGTPFGAVGLDVVYAFNRDLYRIAYGAQLRFGYAWAQDRGKADVHPDVMVFALVTPFAASRFGPGDASKIDDKSTAPAPGQVVGGVRMGFGITAPLWTRTALFNHAFDDDRGFYGETMRVLTTLLLAPVALLNHAELAFQVVGGDPFSTAITFRVGSGF